MDDASRCEVCGGPLVQEQELGLSCPRCLLSLAMPGENVGRYDAGARLEPGTTIGRYRIVRLIGDGGMGTVYEAEQESPRRTVALKLIKPEFTNLELLRRFEQESRALGRLQHPGIAQIYEAGTADTGNGPQPYLAMEFIHGKSLGEYAGQHHLSARDRLALLARVCDAVHHAHQRGLIHRDLKPANILVDETGQPKVLDFGVARVTDGDVQTTLYTGIGQLVGTLAYMSPEQVFDDPLELDTRSDVYALGVVCYELLANRMPYSIGKTVLEAAHAIREEDPARLSSFNRSYRGDIETIAARALEKDKTRRYSSAAELASDIRRYLNDEPIVARPPSARYQLQKFARRNKALVTGIVAVLVVSAAGAATATWLTIQANRERDRATQAETETGIERDRANANEKEARELLTVANKEKARADDQAALSRRDRDISAWRALALESIRLSGNRDNDELAHLLARQSLLIHGRTPDQPRYLVEEALQQAARVSPFGRVISSHSSFVTSLAFSQDGTRLASGGGDHTVRVLDLNNPNAAPLIFPHPWTVIAVAISPDGKLLATSTAVDQTVRIWNLREPMAPSRTLMVPTKDGKRAPITFSVAFSPDGSLLAIGSSSGVFIWALPNLTASPLMVDSDSDITSIAFSPDGSRLATSGSGGVRVWGLRNPASAPLMQLDRDSKFISVAFSSDDMHVAALHSSDQVRVWDLRVPNSSGRTLEVPVPGFYRASRTNGVAFSPDGKQLASCGEDGFIRVWNLVHPGTLPALSLRGHGGIASAVAFSPDGALLASAGHDSRVHIWSLRESDGPFGPFKAHQGAVESLAFSPNNAYIASGDADGTVRLWNARGPKQDPITLKHQDRVGPLDYSHSVTSLDFSQNSQLLASASLGFVRVWMILHPATPPLSFPLAPVSDFVLGESVQAFGFSPDNTMLTAFSIDGRDSPRTVSVKRWDLRSAQTQTMLKLTGDYPGVGRSSDWSRVAGPAQADGSIQVWDLRRPTRPELSLVGYTEWAKASAFAQRGDLIASIGRDDHVRVWKLDNPNAPIMTFPGPGFGFVAFALEDTRLLVRGMDAVRMWDLREPGAPPVVFKGGNADFSEAAVSRDGAYLAAGDREGNIWVSPLWKAAADQLCARITRNLSMEEWRFYVGQSIPYERTCPALPAGTGAR